MYGIFLKLYHINLTQIVGEYTVRPMVWYGLGKSQLYRKYNIWKYYQSRCEEPYEPISYNGIDYQQRYSICPSNNSETPEVSPPRKR